MAKIIGNTTATPNPRPDWAQIDETKADYIKNKPTVLTEDDVKQLIVENGGGGGDVVNQIQADWNQTDTERLDYIKNKPTLGALSSKDTVSLDEVSDTDSHVRMTSEERTKLSSVPEDFSVYVTTEQFEVALGAYITDIDNMVGDGIETEEEPSEPAPTLISFTIAGTTYQAEEGMTWEQWCASEYNTGGYSVDSGGNIFSNGNRVDDDSTALAVTKTDTIVSGGTYRHTSAGGAG